MTPSSNTASLADRGTGSTDRADERHRGATLAIAVALAVVLSSVGIWFDIGAAEARPTDAWKAPPPPPDELTALYDSFDRDANGALDLAEARSFFVWTEKNVRARHDDENAKARRGLIIGDGRPGWNYQQTPRETFEERAGDCEDMTAFTLAFYGHWGVTAYGAFVGTKDRDKVDHVYAVVRANELTDDPLRWQPLDRHALTSANPFDVPAGDYVVVDNALANHFGEQAGTHADGGYSIHHVKTLDRMLGGRA